MIAASYSLVSEGINYEAEDFGILAHYKFFGKKKRFRKIPIIHLLS